jgi:hypothetical protein
MTTQSDDPTSASHPPNHDGDFMMVVIAFGVALVVGLIVAVIFVSGVGDHLLPGQHMSHPTSQLVTPAATQGTNEYSFIIPQQKNRTCV